MDIAFNDVLIPDFVAGEFRKKSVGIENGLIVQIEDEPIQAKRVIKGDGMYLTPGLIDCHCHIESSHLLPVNFGNAIMKYGTLHAVCDCHEIANVRGREGLEFFMENAKYTPCNLLFAIPSCVPATEFATSGGRIDVEDVEILIKRNDVVSLGELMNVPAVISKDERFMRMIEIAKSYKKRINGHAPHLTAEELKRYVEAGVEDDHESETYDELKEKIEAGLHVFLREGSAEHTDIEAYRITEEYPDKVMFCSDDKTAGDILRKGHINFNLKKAIEAGIDPILALKAASYNGLEYYGLSQFSSVEVGKRAYLVLFDKDFNVRATVVDGKLLQDDEHKIEPPQSFLHTIEMEPVEKPPRIAVKQLAIGAKNGSLITEKIEVAPSVEEFDLERDMLKLCVFERYGHGNSSACRITGFGLKRGAIASSLAHDCHNIVAVGTSDEAITKAANEIVKNQGGLALFDGEEVCFVPLQVGGIVSTKGAEDVAREMDMLKRKAKALGTQMDDPFATLSFMALEVIPKLKLTDKGLFDVERFCYVES